MATPAQSVYGLLAAPGAMTPDAGVDPTVRETVTQYESTGVLPVQPTPATTDTSSLSGFLTQTVAGIPLWMLLAAGAVWYFSEKGHHA